MNKVLKLLALVLFITNISTAQTWKWGRRGGSSSDNGIFMPKETVVDMATDKKGNVYIMALGITGFGTSPNVDGHTLTCYGDRDIIIAKFDCNGVYKWSKCIGGAGTDIPCAIGTDTLGHVYVCGKTWYNNPPDNTHYSTDTAQQAGSNKTLFLIQYDTSGNFKWLRQPNPDTVSYLGAYTCQSYDMKVLPNGDVYWLVKLHDGLVSGSNGWAVTGKHPYIVHYNAAGAIVDHADLQMECDMAAFNHIGLERTRGGKFIISGGQEYYSNLSNFTMGGQQMTHSMFVGMFGPTGQLIWKKENSLTVNNSKFTGRPVADASGIYIGGTMSNLDTFNASVHVNTFHPTYPVTCDPFVCKLDTASGNTIWFKDASGIASNYTVSLAMRNANELYVSGDYTSVWWSNTVKVESQANGGTHFYVARFNTQGTVLGIDSLKSSFGPDNFFGCSAADGNGGVFIGGDFNSDLHVAGQTLTTAGGFSDFFVAKLGYTCNCTAPVSAFTTTVSSLTISPSYTGTVAGADSVVWNYGNGITATRTGSAINTPFTYTYPQGGTYTVCATVYNDCGSHQYCATVTVFTTGIESVAAFANVKLYPNPANDYITIEGAATGTTAHVLSLVGQQVRTINITSNKQAVSIADLAIGTYLVELVNENGAKATIRLVKQ